VKRENVKRGGKLALAGVMLPVGCGIWVSLLLVTVTLWASSYFCSIGWRFFSQDEHHSWTTDIETVSGGIQFRQDIRTPYPFIVSQGPRWRRGRQTAWVTQSVLGFGKRSYTYPWGTSATGMRTVITAPWIVIVVPLGVVAYLCLLGVRRLRQRDWRRLNGLCLRCGYDLRESSNRCPECGSVAKEQ
jgi:hypothetical protein